MSVNLGTLERAIANDKKGVFTLIALSSAIAIFVNSVTVSSLALGALFSSTYFLVNSVFLGHLFFEGEGSSFRIAFGILTLLMLVSLGNAIAMFVTALEILSLKFDVKVITVVLVLITGVTSIWKHLQSWRGKPKNKT